MPAASPPRLRRTTIAARSNADFSMPAAGTSADGAGQSEGSAGRAPYPSCPGSSSAAVCGTPANGALVVDGTNLHMMTRADAGWGTTHAEAFSEWLAGLVGIAASQLGVGADVLQLYVVFDNKRGGRMGASPVRQGAVPGYLSKRHAKEQGRSLGRSSGAGGNAPGAASTSSATGAAADSKGASASSSQLRQQSQQQGRVRVRVEQLAAQSEALMDSPPSHLAPFVAAVQRLRGMVLYGMPGYEADDMIGSLVAGLLLPGEEAVLPGASGAGAAPATSSSTTTLMAAGPAGGLTASNGGGPLPHVMVASADSDMLQLLALPGCCWLELRQLSRAASAQQPPPLAVRAEPLPGVPAALMRLHTAAGEAEHAARGSTFLAGGLAPPPPPLGGSRGEEGGAGPQAPLPPLTHALPAACLPDYLALVGKPEAGVAGVGLSARAARNLLLRCGSIDGVARAHAAGLLDERLRPANSRTPTAAAAGVGAVNGAGGGSGRRGEAAAASVGALRGSAALAQALRNLRATRMHIDPASVPTARLHPPLHLHPYDRLHRRSAAPSCGALAAALRRRGLACCTDHRDAGGLLYDLVVSLNGRAASSGGGLSAGVAGGVSAEAGAGLQEAGGCGLGLHPEPRGAAASAEQQLLQLASAAADAVAASLVALLAGGGGMDIATSVQAVASRSNGDGSSSQVARPAAELETLRVAVLSPWDFSRKQQDPLPAQPLQQAAPGPHPELQGGSGPAHQASTNGARVAGAAASAPAINEEGRRLLAFAAALKTAAGPRRSLLHTPAALQALLRPTSAWRLKSMQRGSGAPLVVVPFYDLLLPLTLPSPPAP
ncbi:hypothetical protein TSOC_001062 [Tetrabaena socialis]|uniref:Uncharacterized protein n=1 Tax=Tetrabaena socialis TaxID=47790 RepID=A0A2J8AHN0_9CHLO|nr:hypothetical protein TSOC_001062 [Tetrabaena socialis]|eukprot:PNH12020.1 hypothetical protein TSOC_001062 [Tetrabaena socialis]